MSTAKHEYLVLSRGQWDANASKADVQKAIDEFYAELDAGRAVNRDQLLAKYFDVADELGMMIYQGVYGSPPGLAKPDKGRIVKFRLLSPLQLGPEIVAAICAADFT